MRAEQSPQRRREDGLGDVAKDDLHVAQASSHAAMGVGIATGCDQGGLLIEESRAALVTMAEALEVMRFTVSMRLLLSATMAARASI